MTVSYVVAVKDSAVGAFNRPFFVPSIAVATRSFVDEVNRASEDNSMNRHPDDYELWSLGTFDDESGLFAAGDHRLVARAKDVKQG
nr:MAG: nonstructural protein [Microvirus sp.]